MYILIFKYIYFLYIFNKNNKKNNTNQAKNKFKNKIKKTRQQGCTTIILL